MAALWSRWDSETTPSESIEARERSAAAPQRWPRVACGSQARTTWSSTCASRPGDQASDWRVRKKTPGRIRSSLVGKVSQEGVQLRDSLEQHPPAQPRSEEPQSSFGAYAGALCREAGRQESWVSCARQSITGVLPPSRLVLRALFPLQFILSPCFADVLLSLRNSIVAGYEALLKKQPSNHGNHGIYCPPACRSCLCNLPPPPPPPASHPSSSYASLWSLSAA